MDINWDAVTTPLGFSAFGLFLVFVYLSKHALASERKWLTPVFALMAIFSLIGGIAVAITDTSTNHVDQHTEGDGSPTIHTTNGGTTTTTTVIQQPQQQSPSE